MKQPTIADVRVLLHEAKVARMRDDYRQAGRFTLHALAMLSAVEDQDRFDQLRGEAGEHSTQRTLAYACGCDDPVAGIDTYTTGEVTVRVNRCESCGRGVSFQINSPNPIKHTDRMTTEDAL